MYDQILTAKSAVSGTTLESVAIQKATPGLDQSDAVGAVPGVQGVVAPELFEALLAQTLPAPADSQTPGNPGNAEAVIPALTAPETADISDTMVAALTAASITAQRGVQSGGQSEDATPALIAVAPADMLADATPSLTVSVPTADSKITDTTGLQLIVKSEVVNHDLIARVVPQQLQIDETVAASEAEMNAEPPAPVLAEVELEAPIHNMPPTPHPLAAVMLLQPGEAYGPQQNIRDMSGADIAEALAPVTVKTVTVDADDDLHDHVTVKLQSDHDTAAAVTVDIQAAMIAPYTPHIQIIEARIIPSETDDVSDETNQSDEIIASISDADHRDTRISEIDPALAAEFTVKAPPANMVDHDAASEPDLVNHRRATVEAPVVLLKQAETARADAQQSQPMAPAARPLEEGLEPVVTYTSRQSTNGNGESFDGDASQQQSEPRREPAQKTNPTFTRANSAAVKEDGMTISSDTVLARVEGATLDIRSLTKFNVRDIEISLGSTPKLDSSSPTPIAVAPDTTVVMRNEPQGTQQAQSASSGDDARRANANDVRLRALERMVVNAAREGSDTIKMQLYPPGLGQIIIRLNMEGARLRLSTRTSNAEATEALRNLEQGLRDALSTSGLDLTQFDVSEDGQERERAPSQQAEQTQPKRGGFSDEVFAIDMNA